MTRGCSLRGPCHLSRRVSKTGTFRSPDKIAEEDARVPRTENKEKKTRRHVNSHVASDRLDRVVWTRTCKKGAPCCLAIPHCASKFDKIPDVNLLAVISVYDHSSLFLLVLPFVLLPLSSRNYHLPIPSNLAGSSFQLTPTMVSLIGILVRDKDSKVSRSAPGDSEQKVSMFVSAVRTSRQSEIAARS